MEQGAPEPPPAQLPPPPPPQPPPPALPPPAMMNADKMRLWWDAQGGLAIYGFDPMTWALQLSASLAAAKEVSDAFAVNFKADLVHISDERLRSFDDGYYLVEMKRLMMQQRASEPPPADKAADGGGGT